MSKFKMAFSTKLSKIEKPSISSKIYNQKSQLQRLQQKKQLVQIKRRQVLYLALDSFPSDSIQTIAERFKRIKKKLMNRRMYIPNRGEELTKIDQQMIQLKEFHTLQTVTSLSSARSRTDTKQQIIQFQLNNQKFESYIGLLSNDKFIISILLICIGVVMGFQYYFFIFDSSKHRKFPKPEL